MGVFNFFGEVGDFVTGNETDATRAYDSKKFLVTAGTAIGGAIVGSSLGSRFGTIGKFGLGIACAIGAPKLVNGIAEDVTGAIDYVNKSKHAGNEDVSLLKTIGANFANLKGQTYNGECDVSDPDIDV